MGLNERIMQLRKQAGWTQEQLGEKLGVSRQAVSKWEAGQANPDVEYLAEMCRLFGVSSDWLLLGKDGPEAPGPVCACCGAVMAAGDAFCSKCGASAAGDQAAGEHYCLYLASCVGMNWAVAQRVARLFEFPWAWPAFSWEGDRLDEHGAYDVVQNAPFVLCRGLTYAQATQGARLFEVTPGAVRIYQEKSMETDASGKERPVGEAVEPEPAPKEPMSPGMVFLMVVLGVIAAILIMSIF